MFKLTYRFINNDVVINFSTLEAAFDAARALDELRERSEITKLQVENAEGGVYLIPRKKVVEC